MMLENPTLAPDHSSELAKEQNSNSHGQAVRPYRGGILLRRSVVDQEFLRNFSNFALTADFF
jgi:hypothetical protein